MEAINYGIPQENMMIGDEDELTVTRAENIQTEQNMDIEAVDGAGIKIEADENMETADASEGIKLPAFGERRQDLYSSEWFELELNNLGKSSYFVSTE